MACERVTAIVANARVFPHDTTSPIDSHPATAWAVDQGTVNPRDRAKEKAVELVAVDWDLDQDKEKAVELVAVDWDLDQDQDQDQVQTQRTSAICPQPCRECSLP